MTPGAGGRLGVLGGAFDPPHVGHAIVAQDVVEALELDRLLVVPTARPPHRSVVLPADVRLGLTRAVFEGDPRIEVSDIEYRREGPSYTVDTLEALREERAPGKLFLVIGTDQLAVIESWYRYRRLDELAIVAVMTRSGAEPPPAAGGRISCITVEVTAVEVSGTRIRERLSAGLPIRYLVPEAIRERVETAWAETMGVVGGA